MGDGSRPAGSDRARKVLDIYSDLECELFLDVGCATGVLAAAIGDACDADLTCGVDRSAPRLEQAAARGVHAVRQDVDVGLAFKSGSFDSIHAGEVLDYLDDPVFFVNEVHRCLAQGGTFVVSAANLASLHNRVALGLGRPPYPMRARADSETDGDAPSPPVLSNRSSLFTLAGLRRLLEREGFEVLEVVPARSEPVDASLLLSVLEGLLARFPGLSYRNIVVCRKRASRGPSGREAGDAKGHLNVEGLAQPGER